MLTGKKIIYFSTGCYHHTMLKHSSYLEFPFKLHEETISAGICQNEAKVAKRLGKILPLVVLQYSSSFTYTNIILRLYEMKKGKKTNKIFVSHTCCVTKNTLDILQCLWFLFFIVGLSNSTLFSQFLNFALFLCKASHSIHSVKPLCILWVIKNLSYQPSLVVSLMEFCPLLHCVSSVCSRETSKSSEDKKPNRLLLLIKWLSDCCTRILQTPAVQQRARVWNLKFFCF